MASRVEARADKADQVAEPRSSIEQPTTPLDVDAIPASSQTTVPSTEVPASPVDPNLSFKTELNDDRIASSIIPSSLTPPPSSQLPTNGATANAQGYTNSQRTAILTPPVTGLYLPSRRGEPPPSEYSPPSPSNVVEAPADELRAMLQACIAEHQKLKMETAHHKLQHNLLSMQAEEDAKRAAVEREMTLREVEALRAGEHMRQARRELSTISESAHHKYNELKRWYDKVVDDNAFLQQKVKNAKKLIQDLEDEILGLRDEKDILLTRLRENREHFHQLCSPGGIFHSVMTPKTQTVTTPVQYRATPRQTPRSGSRGRRDRDHDDRIDDALLQAANFSQENNSAPSTPATIFRQLRNPSKHTRNVQSLSSLPTTPIKRHRQGHSGLLPSADLVPQTEPPRRYHSHRQYIPETPTHDHDDDRKDRESTISAEEDNEELARQALQSFASRVSRGSGSHPHRHHHGDHGDEEEEVYESQATQAASDMLRRDPRESFEVASSRGGTPVAVGEKSAKLQAKLLGSLGKGGAGEKRKFGEGLEEEREVASPSKRRRAASSVGLGIQ